MLDKKVYGCKVSRNQLPYALTMSQKRTEEASSEKDAKTEIVKSELVEYMRVDDIFNENNCLGKAILLHIYRPRAF